MYIHNIPRKSENHTRDTCNSYISSHPIYTQQRCLFDQRS